ncbi:MAG: lysylphosphatidylglycerol synthase domain-containing protein, partial [Bacteroidota bacterium]
MPELSSLRFKDYVRKKNFFIAIQILISISALYYIYLKIEREDIALVDLYGQLGREEASFAFLCLLLIPVNWGLEAYKWKFVLRNVYPGLGFLQAFKGVLTGISTGIFTPNRVGDYAGRLFQLEAGKRWEAGMLLLMDRLSQLIVTLWVGIYCMLYLFFSAPGKIEDMLGLDAGTRKLILLGLILASLLLSLGLLFVKYLPFSRLSPKRSHPFLSKVQVAASQLAPTQFLYLLFLGSLRYMTYSLQYLLLMLCFGFSQSLALGFLLIGLIFLLKSIVPYLAFTELGVR